MVLSESMLSPLSSLRSPIKVTLVDAYGDGTIWFSLKGSCDRHATLCIDGRAESPTRYRLFDGGRHPNSNNMTLIDLGGVEEGIVIPVVSHWVDSGEMERWFTEYGVEKFLETFNRYGEPQVQAVRLTNRSTRS